MLLKTFYLFVHFLPVSGNIVTDVIGI